MEKKNTMTVAGKKQVKFENKGIPIAWVRQEKGGVSTSCNLEIVQHQLK